MTLFLLCLGSAQNRGLSQEVALTFDDLPSHGPLPRGVTRVDVAKGVIQALRQANAPKVYGFINAKLLQDAPKDVEVLKLWTTAGFPLGNHTWSHLDLNTTSAETFEKDVAKNESALRQFMSFGGWHWFRYPFLHEGETPQKKHAIQRYLSSQGYRIAEVTLSFEDYIWNEPYVRCADRHDFTSMETLKASYLQAADESLRIGQEMARLIWGRDIKHAMLLHIGAFQTIMLPRLIALLKTDGFKLITLEDAESDDAYRIEPALPSRWEGTLIDQMIRAKGLKRPQSLSWLPKLEGICR